MIAANLPPKHDHFPVVHHSCATSCCPGGVVLRGLILCPDTPLDSDVKDMIAGQLDAVVCANDIVLSN
jgi:hypothetical protein